MLKTPHLGTPAVARVLRTTVLAAAALAALVGSLLPATAASADDINSISISPAGENGAGDRSRFDYQASPGQRLEDSVEVSNTGTTRQDITVLSADAFNTEDGSFSLIETDAESVDSGNWVTFDGQKRVTVSLDPGASQTVAFVVDVPADARPGDHAAGIVASATEQSDQIVVDRRVATRMYVRVPGELQPALSITGMTASYDQMFNPFDGGATLTYTVENTGNVALGGTTAIGVRTWFGIGVSEVLHPEVSELLPGNRLTMTTTVPGIGQWGLLNPYVELQPVTVDEGALAIPPMTQISRDTFVPAIPWWLLIVVLIGGLGYLILRISRSRDEKRAAAWIAFNEEQARERAREELVSTGPARPSDSQN